MRIQKLNESLIDKLNSLPQEPGVKYNKSSIYEVVKEYQNILRQYPIGTVLTHQIDAGTEKFTKIEDGKYGFWEHLRMPWGVSQKTSEFDVARWLACRANITRGKIIQEKLNNMKIQKLNESNDSKYITDEIASKTNSQEIKDAIDKNNLSVLVRDNTWYTEKCPNGLGKALKDEMKKLYPDLKHMYGESTSIKTFGAKGKKLNESGYKLTIKKDGKTFNDYCYDYRKESAVAQMKAKYGDDIEVLDVVEHNKINEGIEVATIADYITDHYKFETIDDKYSCIDSITDSFKDGTISKEELEQFIGAHNGKDKIEEGIDGWDNRTGVIKRIDKYLYDNPEATPPKGYINKHSRAYDDAVSRYGNYITTPFGNISTDDLMKYARDNKLLDESMKDYRFEVSCNDGPTKVVKLIWDEKDVEGAKEMAKKYYAQEHTTYADDRHNKWIIEESLEENVQYGVHQFSTDSIIFRGTEEECGEYIDNNKNLWDDAEVYMMNPNDPHYKKDLNEASYGGAFDIADDQLFTREDIDNLAEEVLNHINETFEEQFDISGAYITDGIIELEITNETLGDFSCNKAIDMRKVKEPWHLKRAYATDCAVDLINQIKEVSDMFESINESTTENAHSIEAGAKFGIASIINSLIVSEYAAIEEYNSAIATAQSEGFDNIVKVLTDIQAEENVHVGQLQELMKLVDPNAVKVEEGKSEGAEQLSDTFNDDDDVFDFFTSDDVEIGNEDDIDDDEVETFIKKVKESMEQKSVENSIDIDELEEEVIIESSEPWEDIYKSFKDIETQLKGDGEAITATIDKLYQDNKHNPDFKKAYDKWASNE